MKSADILKAYSENILPPFATKLLNKLYDLNVFPPDWCKCVIIPLFKKVMTLTQTITREFPY